MHLITVACLGVMSEKTYKTIGDHEATALTLLHWCSTCSRSNSTTRVKFTNSLQKCLCARLLTILLQPNSMATSNRPNISLVHKHTARRIGRPSASLLLRLVDARAPPLSGGTIAKQQHSLVAGGAQAADHYATCLSPIDATHRAQRSVYRR